MATRYLKVGKTKTNYKNAYSTLSVAYAASIALTAAQVDFKETIVTVGALTGALALTVAVTGSKDGDILIVHFIASGASRTVTPGAGFDDYGALVIPDTKRATMMFMFDGTNFREVSRNIEA